MSIQVNMEVQETSMQVPMSVAVNDISADMAFAEQIAPSVPQAQVNSPVSLVSNALIAIEENGTIHAFTEDEYTFNTVNSAGLVDAGTQTSVSVTGEGTYSLQTIGATTYTPSQSTQIIPEYKWLTGDQTILPIPSQYYDMSGDMAWLGADATLVQTFNLSDVKLSATDFATWTPSTTAADILATRNAGTFVADMVNYDYYIISKTSIPVVASASAVKKALPILTAGYQVQMITRRPNNWSQIINDSFVIQVCVSTYTSCFLQYYGTTTGTASYTWAASYGLYSAVTPATLSSNSSNTPTITVKTPKVSARCSTTYMSTANAALIDQDKTIISQVCEVYRVKTGTGFLRGLYGKNVDFINEVRQ